MDNVRTRHILVPLLLLFAAPAVFAQTGTLFVEGDSVGIGVATPDSQLHVQGDTGTTKLHVEEISGTAQQRELFLLENNGGVRFAFEDSSTGLRIVMRNVNAQFQVDMNNDLAPEMRLFANGDLRVTGSLFSNGSSCGGGCDRVFDPEYPLETIEEHALRMWEQGFLPAVGPTPEGAPMNLTEKVGGMLNELEKAHLYIVDLNQQLEDKQDRLDQVERANEDLMQRQADLEERLQALQAQIEMVLTCSSMAR